MQLLTPKKKVVIEFIAANVLKEVTKIIKKIKFLVQ